MSLNTNENPYPASPRVFRRDYRKAINHSLRLYPEPLRTSSGAVERLGSRVKRENILAGNGSDEILSIIMRSFIGAQDRAAFPVPDDSLSPPHTPPAFSRLSRALWMTPAGFFCAWKHWQRKAPRSLSSCNPNSPSGTCVLRQEIERLARAVAQIRVIDEAYVDFAESEGASTLPLIGRLPNLIVLRTFSKSFSLAGMRIGLAFASGGNHLRHDESEGLGHNLNRLSLVAASAALRRMSRRRARSRTKPQAAQRRD